MMRVRSVVPMMGCNAYARVHVLREARYAPLEEAAWRSRSRLASQSARWADLSHGTPSGPNFMKLLGSVVSGVGHSVPFFPAGCSKLPHREHTWTRYLIPPVGLILGHVEHSCVHLVCALPSPHVGWAARWARLFQVRQMPTHSPALFCQ